MEDPHEIFGIKPGEPVPVVSVEDLKKVRETSQEVKDRHPDGQVGIGMGVWKQILPNAEIADVMALTYRSSMLGILEMFLEATYPGGHISDNALKVAAEMELKWIPFGVPQKGLAFSMEDFLATVYGSAQSEKQSS
jgi:hypothetical protein